MVWFASQKKLEPTLKIGSAHSPLCQWKGGWTCKFTKMMLGRHRRASSGPFDDTGLRAIKAGVNLRPGQRFGFHNLRHSLSSLLITGQKSDVRTTQDILRHSNSATTIELYTQSPMAQRIAAQESVLSALLKQPTARVRIRVVRRRARNGSR